MNYKITSKNLKTGPLTMRYQLATTHFIGILGQEVHSTNPLTTFGIQQM